MKSLVLLILLIPALAWAEPVIVFQAENHDFGEVAPGDHPEFTFEFSNAGSDELVISTVTTFT